MSYGAQHAHTVAPQQHPRVLRPSAGAERPGCYVKAVKDRLASGSKAWVGFPAPGGVTGGREVRSGVTLILRIGYARGHALVVGGRREKRTA